MEVPPPQRLFSVSEHRISLSLDQLSPSGSIQRNRLRSVSTPPDMDVLRERQPLLPPFKYERQHFNMRDTGPMAAYTHDTTTTKTQYVEDREEKSRRAHIVAARTDWDLPLKTSARQVAGQLAADMARYNFVQEGHIPSDAVATTASDRELRQIYMQV